MINFITNIIGIVLGIFLYDLVLKPIFKKVFLVNRH